MLKGHGVRRLTSAAAEPPRAFSDTCGRDGCSNEVAGPFDLFCVSADGGGALHLLPLAGDRRMQTIAVYVLRAVFAPLPLLAASSRSAIPLYVGAVIAGLLILALPLRRSRSRVCSLPCCGSARSAWRHRSERDSSMPQRQATSSALVALTLAALLGTVFMRRAPDGSEDLSLRGISTGLAFVLASGALCVAFALGFADVTKTASHLLLIACISAAGGVCTTAIIAGLVRGVRSIKHGWSFTKPRPLPRKSMPNPPRTGAPDMLSRLLFRIAGAVANAVNSTCELLYRALDLVVLWAALAVHYCKLVTVWIAKLLAVALCEAVHAIYTAARALAGALRHLAQTTVLALRHAAAAAAVNACSLFRSYLDGGTLLDAIFSIILALLAAAALAAIWWALTRRPARDVAASALRSAEAAGPAIFLTLVALGWIDGIVGMLGHGPMRPGWLTITGTIVLALGLVVAYRNNRNEDLPAAKQDASA